MPSFQTYELFFYVSEVLTDCVIYLSVFAFIHYQLKRVKTALEHIY